MLAIWVRSSYKRLPLGAAHLQYGDIHKLITNRKPWGYSLKIFPYLQFWTHHATLIGNEVSWWRNLREVGGLHAGNLPNAFHVCFSFFSECLQFFMLPFALKYEKRTLISLHWMGVSLSRWWLWLGRNTRPTSDHLSVGDYHLIILALGV